MIIYMSDIARSEQVIPTPAVSSLSGNAASYEDKGVTSGVTAGGKKRRSKSKKVAKKVAKRKTAKKCWWKFF